MKERPGKWCEMIMTGTESIAQLIAILFVFVLVLGATAFTTKWIANYQKQQNIGSNIELLDALRLNNNKYLQIVRVGSKYIALAVCKDTVTVLCELSADELKPLPVQTQSFMELFDKMMKKDSGNPVEPKEDVHEE